MTPQVAMAWSSKHIAEWREANKRKDQHVTGARNDNINTPS